MISIISPSEVSSLAHNFNWSTPSWELFIFLFWGVASVFYAFSAGRGRIISLLMSLYIAKLLVLEAPWLTGAINQKLPAGLASMQQLVSFSIIFIILFVLLNRYAFRTSADGRQFTSIPFTLVFSILQFGLLISTVLIYLSTSGLKFSPLVSLIFISGHASFVWLIAPLVFLIVLGRAVADPAEV